jgi:phage shock protein PspC (stress-responsive transcriptional regulator)
MTKASEEKMLQGVYTGIMEKMNNNFFVVPIFRL